jgi:hypothetical protein
MARRSFSDWSGTVTFTPAAHFHPRSLEGLIDVVRLARRSGVRLRCAGAGHSSSPILETDGFLVHMGRLDKIRPGPEPDTVICQAGVLTSALNVFLHRRGQVIGSNTALTEVQVGGIVSTGSHGTGRGYGVISDRVCAIRLVDHEGCVRDFDERTTAPEVMDVVRLGLGLLGVVYEVTLRVEPAAMVRTIGEVYPLEQIFDPGVLRRLVLENEWLECHYFPFSPELHVQRSNRLSDRGCAPSLAHEARMTLSKYLHIVMGNTISHLATRRPRIMYLMGRRGWAHMAISDRVQPLADAMHYLRGIPHGPRVINPELAFGFDAADCSTVIAALRASLELIHAEHLCGRYPCSVGLNIRFTGPSRALLSPACHGADYTCWLGAVSFIATPGARDFYDHELSPRLMANGALPHWPKYWQNIPGVTARLRAGYGARLERFQAVRRAMDPEDRFLNHPLAELFSGQGERPPTRASLPPA